MWPPFCFYAVEADWLWGELTLMSALPPSVVELQIYIYGFNIVTASTHQQLVYPWRQRPLTQLLALKLISIFMQMSLTKMCLNIMT